MGHVDTTAVMMQRRKNSAGFTLMEVVVAITLMSLLMLTLMLGLRLTANAWNRGEQKLEEHARLLSGTDVIAQQVSAAVVRVVTDHRGIERVPVQLVAFSGAPYQLRFCTPVSWRGDRSRPQYMANYRVIKDAAGKQQLVIGEIGLTDDDSVLAGLALPAPKTGEPVGDPADQIEFAYFQPATTSQPAQWMSEWQTVNGGPELPPAVRVRWVRGQDVQESTFPIAIFRTVKQP